MNIDKLVDQVVEKFKDRGFIREEDRKKIVEYGSVEIEIFPDGNDHIQIDVVAFIKGFGIENESQIDETVREAMELAERLENTLHIDELI